MSATRTLIRGGCVLTLGTRTPNFAEADVLIEDGRVAEVGPGLRARDADVVDAAHAVIMPGFVDTHRHAARSLFRNVGDGDPTGNGMGLTEHFEPGDVYAATLVGLLGAVEAGITTVVDWSDISLEPSYLEAALQAHADAGLRAVLIPVPSTSPAAGDGIVREVHRLASERTGAGIPATTFAFGAAEPDGTSLEQIASCWALAREHGLRIHVHAGTDAGHAGAIAELATRDLLGDDVTLVHCSKLDASDLDAIASSHTAVALTPSSDMAGGLGAPPIQELIDRGIRPGLGVDDERLAPGDVFAQMRAVISMQHAAMFDLKLAGKAGLPNLLTTREAIRYATVDGARVAGLGAVTGSLEPGKQADIVVLRTDRPNISPINDPIGAVVWGMDTSNIAWVFAGGKPLMRDGVLDADVGTVRELAKAAQRNVSAAAGSMAEARKGATS